MNRTAKTERLKALLLRHWLVIVLGFMGLLFLGLLAVKNLRQIISTTPIARIDPEDSLKIKGSSSRLESYREEMEEVNRRHIRRQLAMEKIIAMDFGSKEVAEQEVEAPKDSLLQKEKSDFTAEKTKQDTRQEKPSPKHKTKQRAEAPQKSGEAYSGKDFFYTVKVEPENFDTDDQGVEKKKLFKAVVNGDQKLISNSTISLRLLEEVKVGETVFPRNTLVNGRLSGGAGARLKISISMIRSVPVKMLVYDQDYQPGIPYLQDEPLSSSLAESRDRSVDQLLYSIPYGGVVGGVAEAGRGVLRKSRKRKPLFLADGYPVFISFGK